MVCLESRNLSIGQSNILARWQDLANYAAQTNLLGGRFGKHHGVFHARDNIGLTGDRGLDVGVSSQMEQCR
jgi:hypothetical protein